MLSAPTVSNILTTRPWTLQVGKEADHISFFQLPEAGDSQQPCMASGVFEPHGTLYPSMGLCVIIR